MTSEPARDHPGAEVVPLRAAEVPTEVQLDEDRTQRPSYVDLSRGEAQRRPIIPEHWRTLDSAKRHVQLAAARHSHRAAYHGVRSPAYFAKAAGFAVWGVIVTIRRLIAWWHIPGTTRLEWQAAADGLLNDHLRLHRQGRETRKARGTDPRRCASPPLAVLVLVMVAFAPWWAWALAARAPVRGVRARGRPQGKTITSRAVLPAEVQPPTQDVIMRALGSLGIAEVNKALTAGSFPPLPSPVREDGPGWRAEVDLPYGVTATPGDRPPRAARLRAAPPARRGVARAGQPRARRAPRAVGRPGGHLQGQAAGVAAAARRAGRTSSSRSRSASTCAAARSWCRWPT